MGIPLRVLFIEDCANDAELQVRLFQNAGYDIEFERVDSPVALTRFLDRPWDLIISDYSMPHYSGTDAVQLVRKLGLETPFIFVSGTIGEETAVAALKMGAQDYLMKDNLNRLVPAVQRELREAEEKKKLRDLEKQVHVLRRYEAIGRLAGGVAHDFNNVIGAIMGWAEIGSSEAPPEGRLHDRFVKIRLQADRAAALTRQLLAFARRQILQPQITDLNELVRQEITLLKNIIGERNSIQLNLAEGLPPVWADPSQIEQVVVNLCLHARDAMPDGGGLTITTEATEVGTEIHNVQIEAVPGRYLLLTVSDTGAGIAAEALEHIFEPFYTTKDVGKGTGLGLATVYGIVKQHKGFVAIDSDNGPGTTFRVYLPAASGKVKTAHRHAETQLQRGTEAILIAEDNEDVRETTRLILESLGYKVFTVSDGAEAVELFRKNQSSVDVVLLDIIMPKLNGTDAALQIAAIKPDIPFVFVTGYATESSLQNIRALDKTQILQKPYDARQLASKIRDALDRGNGN